ncbi:nucleotidyltransferase family protein [Bacteroides sp.]|uniref:nucleotidyltransferase family protein n=1 Tax=Bacteroides sp. TaxID=29523 RepID=UPI00258E1EB2|nr:nucleotidyltransferase family protein [Bacteroides sp.]
MEHNKGEAERMNVYSNLTKECFFRLIRLGIGTEDYTDFPTLDRKHWMEVCRLGESMALLGIMFSGIEKLPEEKRPEKNILLRLVERVLQTKKMNDEMNRKSVEMYELYEKEGFSPILLKGQGTATFYPRPERRMPGDVDLWLMGGETRLMNFLHNRFDELKIEGMHVTPVNKEYEGVELHAWPCTLNSPVANKKLVNLLEKWKNEGSIIDLPNGTGKVCIPLDRMNRTYMLIHKYNHFKGGGIGLKQVLDYMMLLKKGFKEEERITSVKDIKALNLDRFCRAVMYVLKEFFGMEDRFLLMKPDKALGMALMDEIFTTGNFGFYDERYTKVEGEWPKAKFRDKLKRKIMQIRMCPQEVFWGHMGNIIKK